MGFIMAIGAAATALLAFIYATESKRLPAKRARFDGREPLSSSAIFTRFFSDTQFREAEFIALWGEIGTLLEISPGVLRPSDRFAVELAPVEDHLVEDELSDLEQLLVRHVGHFDVSVRMPTNLQELVHLVLSADQRNRA